MTFPNKFIRKIYRYIFLHDDETILLKDMASDLNICDKTCRKYIRWLEIRGLIKKSGKHYSLKPLDENDDEE